MPGIHAVWGFAALNPAEVLRQVQLGVSMEDMLSSALAIVRMGSEIL